MPCLVVEGGVVDEEEEAIAAAGGWTMTESAERALDAVDGAFVGRFGGSFFENDGTLVALVKDLDPAEESKVSTRLGLKEAGVRLASAPYSEADLESFADAIDDDNVSAVEIDVQRSQLVLHVVREFKGSELADLLADVPANAVRVEVGEFRQFFH